MTATCIVLNGSSCSGKSSIAAALQRLWPRPLQVTGVDTFLASQSKRFFAHDGRMVDGFSWIPTTVDGQPAFKTVPGPLGLGMIRASHAYWAACADAGLDQVIDDVWLVPDQPGRPGGRPGRCEHDLGGGALPAGHPRAAGTRTWRPSCWRGARSPRSRAYVQEVRRECRHRGGHVPEVRGSDPRRARCAVQSWVIRDPGLTMPLIRRTDPGPSGTPGGLPRPNGPWCMSPGRHRACAAGSDGRRPSRMNIRRIWASLAGWSSGMRV